MDFFDKYKIVVYVIIIAFVIVGFLLLSYLILSVLDCLKAFTFALGVWFMVGDVDILTLDVEDTETMVESVSGSAISVDGRWYMQR